MEARRCSIHGLVAAEDGRCVICRRGEAEPEEAPPPLVSTGTIVFAVGCLAIMGLVLYWLEKPPTKAAPEPPSIVVAPDRPAPNVAANAPVDEPKAPSPRQPDFFASPPPSATPAASDREIVVGSEPKEDPRLTEAKHRVAIKMYVTPWCDYCRLARVWMTKQGYRWTEFDVSQSDTDKVELRALNPEMTTPTFTVGGQPLVGFDPDLLDQSITRIANAQMARR